jgi:hypothetical protein
VLTWRTAGVSRLVEDLTSRLTPGVSVTFVADHLLFW